MMAVWVKLCSDLIFFVDITVCEDTNNGGCEQNCTNTNGSFICSCRDGFTLSADQRSCDGN